MNKFFLTAILTAATVGISCAGVKVTAIPVGDKPTNTPAKVYSTTEHLIYENFDKWTGGSADEPNVDDPLTSYYDREIDPKMMNGKMQWTGYQVYEAGGACALHPSDPQTFSTLGTPKGDYSGSVKLTFLAKYLPVSWTQADGTEIITTGCSVSVGLYSDSGVKFDLGEGGGSASNLTDGLRLYEKFGWYEVSVEFDNYTASNDAYFQFFSTDGLLVDDIKITSSVDKFIAAPVIENVTDVTETSFTVNFEPVRKAFNYYAYLYELRGYDEETGEPIFFPIPEPKTFQKYVEAMGELTYEDYWKMRYSVEDFDTEWYLDQPYCYYGVSEDMYSTSFTYEGLDPEKEYYFGIASHYVYTFSTQDIYRMNQIAAPVVLEASKISDNSFTARWNPVAKADSYEINLYGVNKVVEDNDNYIIFEEDFENVSLYTEADDIYAPGIVDEESGIVMDDLTTTPGWVTGMSHVRLVKGMLGHDGKDWIASPQLYVAGSDKITVSLRVEFERENTPFTVEFAGVEYASGGGDSVFEEEFDLPTNGLEVATLRMKGAMYVDYIVITQSLKEGDYTYTFMGSDAVDANEFAYSQLDTDSFDMYGYAVQSVKGEGKAAIYSGYSDRIIVDLKAGKSFAGITAVNTLAAEEATETERYTIDGRKVSEPVRGINIIKMSDGSFRKVFVR